MNVPDNYDLWEANERKMEAALSELPVCEDCGKPIRGDYLYVIEDKLVCEKCLERKYRRNVEDFIM